jgi:hypothetical protein
LLTFRLDLLTNAGVSPSVAALIPGTQPSEIADHASTPVPLPTHGSTLRRSVKQNGWYSAACLSLPAARRKSRAKVLRACPAEGCVESPEVRRSRLWPCRVPACVWSDADTVNTITFSELGLRRSRGYRKNLRVILRPAAVAFCLLAGCPQCPSSVLWVLYRHGPSSPSAT